MAIDDRKTKMADRWDALVAQGIGEDEATELVKREFERQASYESGRLAKNVAEKNAAEKMGWLRTNVGGAVDALLGSAETVAAGVPGAKLAMSKGRSLLSGEPMRAVQEDINERTSDVPYASAVGRAVGSTVPFLAGPGASLSAAEGGAALMGLDRLLANDPDATVSDRITGGIKMGLLGAVGGKGAEMASTGVRAIASPSLGKAADAIKKTMRDTDEALYGAAEREGMAVGSTPEIAAVLKSKTVAPFARTIRGLEQFTGADDATVLREAYKLMSEQSVRRGTALAGAADFKAGTSFEKEAIDLAKKRMLDAADTAMPSFRKAVEAHAQNAKVNRAFALGANASRREMTNASIAGEKLAKLSPTATRRALGKMSKPEAEAFTTGVLGRTSEMMTPTSTIINMFGIPRAIRGVYRAGPLLRAGDAASGSTGTILAERGLLSLLNAKMGR